jgi:heat shock protein HtpX
MTLVMFLLGALFVGIVVVLMSLFWSSSPGIAVLIGLAGLGVAWWQWYSSDTLAMKAMRAREVSPQEAPELHGMIDRLCALADMPKPRVGIADTSMPNAFATGRSPKRAVVVVTTGILRRLDAEELEGVLAHELSHVAHRDVLVMTVASSAGIVAGMLTRGAQYGAWFGGGRRRDDNTGLPVWLVVLVVSIVVYAVSFLLLRLLSRYRELSADRAGAQLTMKPRALASALQKITGEINQIPTADLRGSQAMNAFFIAPAVSGVSLRTLTSTHPSLEQRLEQLARIEAELGRPAD